jgi:RHS repeat-associated protein
MYGDKIKNGWYFFNSKAFDDESGLYYYGARYYDPKLGRFITPDTIVQAPSNPQTLNRYTYCNNNPVNLIDPTGHKWKWSNIIKAAAIAVVGIALTIATGGAMAAMGFAAQGFWSSVAVGAVMGGTIGGASSAALGGNIGQGILTGAISGAVFGGIGSWAQTNQIGNSMRAFAHGVGGAATGAVNSAITGGNIGQGALISGLSAGLGVKFGGSNILSRTAFGGLVGGVASTATGGDFWTGAKQAAITSAIAFVVNDTAHPGVAKDRSVLNVTDDRPGLLEGLKTGFQILAVGTTYLFMGGTISATIAAVGIYGTIDAAYHVADAYFNKTVVGALENNSLKFYQGREDGIQGVAESAGSPYDLRGIFK